MKKMIVITCVVLLLTGCSSNIEHTISSGSTESVIFNMESSYFNKYTSEQTDTAYVVKGQVIQKNDNNAIVVFIHADTDTTINVTGTLKKVSGNDNELIYVSEDGEQTKIADNASDSYDITVDIAKGDGKVLFTGENAVYNFETEFELIDGVTFLQQ